MVPQALVAHACFSLRVWRAVAWRVAEKRAVGHWDSSGPRSRYSAQGDGLVHSLGRHQRVAPIQGLRIGAAAGAGDGGQGTAADCLREEGSQT